MRLFYILAFLILGTLSGLAQSRKYSNAFLDIGVDARSMALSNSSVAHGSDINAAYTNAAGLRYTQDYQFSFMHAEYFGSIANYDYLAAAIPVDSNSVFGVSLIRFGVDNIQNTVDLIDKDGNIDYSRISLFSAADYALLLSYARKSKVKGLSFGGNFKLIYRHIGDFAQAFGFGFDLGAQYRSGQWMFGANFRDITTTFNAWTVDEEALGEQWKDTENEAPEDEIELTLPKLQIGAARNFAFKNKMNLLAEVDLHMMFGGRTNDIVSSDFINMTPSAGLELDYDRLVYLRAGTGNFQNATTFSGSKELAYQPNIGVGFMYRGIAIDYALTDLGDQSAALYSNIFSIRFDLYEWKKH